MRRDVRLRELVVRRLEALVDSLELIQILLGISSSTFCCCFWFDHLPGHDYFTLSIRDSI